MFTDASACSVEEKCVSLPAHLFFFVDTDLPIRLALPHSVLAKLAILAIIKLRRPPNPITVGRIGHHFAFWTNSASPVFNVIVAKYVNKDARSPGEKLHLAYEKHAANEA